MAISSFIPACDLNASIFRVF